MLLTAFSGCKLKIEAANEEGPPESSNGARLLAAQPSTSQPVTVSCEAKVDLFLFINFCAFLQAQC